MRKLLYSLLLTAPFLVKAQNYSTAAIPESLRKGARVVVREKEVILEIKSPGRATEKEHEVYTIMNPSGDNLAGYNSFYDKFTDISSISGVLYDSLGKNIKKVKRKEMDDRGYEDGFSLASDARYLEHNFYCRSYPYTVEYQQEDEYNGIRYFNDWLPLLNSGIATQHSKYTVIAPKDYLLRWQLRNGAQPPVITVAGDKKTYTWEAHDLPARHRETAGPRWREMVPYVMLGPSEFEAQGYKGDMSTWTGYGKFIEQLRIGRDVLPDDIKRQVHALTDTITDRRRKVYTLYQFLQQNTHYISVQLGIGGWQPFSAEYVATRKYGDCKALSNYMIALLKEAGITGKYVEIEAGEDAVPLFEGFPESQFDHVISCVPMEKDTIWLECTSQTKSAGYMGTFTGDRKGLLIDDEGGHVVQTPFYSASDNTQCRVIHAQLGPEGDLDAEVNTEYRCIRQELAHEMIYMLGAEQREKYLNGLFSLPTYKVEKSHYEEQKGPKPIVREDLHVIAPSYATVTGRRLFITPNLFDRSSKRLSTDTARKYDYITDRNYTDIDSIVIAIPTGYQAEAMPKDVVIDGKFGRFTASVKFENDQLIYYRYLQQTANRYPAADYTTLVRFYEQMYQADNQRVVLVKKE
jgi:transglutaminase-like putative cysteine protease